MANPIDLYTVRFWLGVGVALFFLMPLTRPTTRKWAFALLNLGFLGMYLGPWPVAVGVVSGVVLICLLLRIAPRQGLGSLVLTFGGLVVLGLFVVHKLPWIGEKFGLSSLDRTLATVGFSYVALRVVDLARAVRDGTHPPPGLVATINYLLPFHMLAAGPIQAYEEFAAQPAIPSPLEAGEALEAIERIADGMFKKFVLANMIQKLFLTDFRAGGPYLLVEMQLNFLWLYLDFSAYSDVAVGVGRLIGVRTPENFNRPYLARNVIDFWERWHISLSRFIQRNVFIPLQLGMMRRTDGRFPLLIASISITIAFLLCGLWHRIDLHWLAWGALQATGLIACYLYQHILVKRLGRKGVKAYLANRWIRLLAIVLTFEFEALTVLVATYPFEELLWWAGYYR